MGLTDDPQRRLGDFQIAHYRPLSFHQVWWVPGKAIAARLENAFKYYFLPDHIRGEWYNLTGDAFLIQGEPVRDRERLVWTLDLRPA